MKRLLCILTLLCILAGLCVLPLSAAEGNVTVRYGAEDLPLTLIDPLDDAGLTFDGSFGFGVATVQNGEMAMTVNGQYFDCYAMTTAALPNASFTGAKYLALSIRNESDGDVYFCLQPIVTAGGANMFLSGELAKKNPVRLVDAKGNAKDAKWSGTRAINGRDCFIVPYKFSGYVLIPLGIIADLNVLSVPVVAEDSGIVAYGFHICPDDATTVRFAISDVYVSGALPEYRDPAAETTMKKRNTLTIGDQLKSYARHPGAGVLAFLTLLGAVITFALLFFLIGYVLVKGIPYLNASLFSLTYTSENVSLLPSLINTLIMTLVSLAIAAPVGIFAAIFLVEYAKKGSRFVKLIRITAETLSGIPSIVYGLFGMLFFVTALHWGMSLLSGALTMVIMVLPLIMRTAEEALKSVPDSYREASFGLGAGKLRTIFTIVLPSAVPGILAGVILAIGRVVGETAALLYTSGTVAAVPNSLMGSGRTLALHMYVLSSEGLHVNQASATAVVILAFVLVINGLSGLVARKIAKG